MFNLGHDNGNWLPMALLYTNVRYPKVIQIPCWLRCWWLFFRKKDIERSLAIHFLQIAYTLYHLWLTVYLIWIWHFYLLTYQQAYLDSGVICYLLVLVMCTPCRESISYMVSHILKPLLLHSWTLCRLHMIFPFHLLNHFRSHHCLNS